MGTWEEEWLDMTKGIPGSEGTVMDYTKSGAMPDMSYLSNNNFAGLYEADKKIANFVDNVSSKEVFLTATPYTPTSTSGENKSSMPGSTPLTKSPVKIATPQYVNFKNDIVEEDADFLKILYFEQINGVMLLSLTNNTSLNTENINYQPIINMAEVQKTLDPKGILALQNTSDKYFLNFPIRLDAKVPNIGNGPSGTNVYIDSSGNLVVESINLNPGEKVEIQTLQNGTIYETDLGVDES